MQESKLTRQDAHTILRGFGMSEDDADEYIAWHVLHANVWHAFQRCALELINKRERIAGKKIAEKVRDHLKGCGCDFAVNNNRISAMSRLFAGKFPQHAGRFEFRRLATGSGSPAHWSDCQSQKGGNLV